MYNVYGIWDNVYRYNIDGLILNFILNVAKALNIFFFFANVGYDISFKSNIHFGAYVRVSWNELSSQRFISDSIFFKSIKPEEICKCINLLSSCTYYYIVIL